MKQKIEWYKEVLEIEPNSKIFFPLARMLAKDGRADEAIAVLRQGAGRHPDHIEARLFLAELLYTSGRPIELQQEIETLSGLFKNYPGFWRAWGERLFDEDTTRDAGLAAIFLAAFLQNMPVSWAGVIEHGLKSLVSENTPRASATLAEAHPLSESVADFTGKPAVSAPAQGTPESPDPFLKFSEAAHEIVSDVPDETDDEADEPITLRTRSMAEILAEQGDIPGALDIYAELLAAASPENKAEIQARMDILSGKTVGSAPETENGEGEASREEKKDWLAILAQRLEARSLQ